MSADKPSRPEKEHFAKIEAERLAKQRRQSQELARLAERHSHHLKCPRCGADLTSEEFHGVQVERCCECHGLWLDAEQIEAVVAHEDVSLLRRVVTDVMASLSGERKGPGRR